MKKSKHFLALGLTTIALAGMPFVAFGASTPIIDQHQANQDKRIDAGKASGKLSKREAARLEAGQAKVDAMEATAKADGTVTKAEAHSIKAEQKKQNKRIIKQKHDHNKQ